uniref:Uncharacterized protein n=1 Tax=Anguilla anguilla TaxID=7936 RepID=A0A0E9VAS8_ANGAN
MLLLNGSPAEQFAEPFSIPAYPDYKIIEVELILWPQVLMVHGQYMFMTWSTIIAYH